MSRWLAFPGNYVTGRQQMTKFNVNGWLSVELCDHSCESSSLPVDSKYQKGQSRDNFINNSK